MNTYPEMNSKIVELLCATDDNPMLLYAAARIEELENELAQWNAIRVEVKQFAFAMEEKLKANDHKGGWDDCHPDWLLNRMRQEVAELEREVSYRRNILDEAADVANFAMMIADVSGYLK